MAGGILSRGFWLGGYCPGGFCPGDFVLEPRLYINPLSKFLTITLAGSLVLVIKVTCTSHSAVLTSSSCILCHCTYSGHKVTLREEGFGLVMGAVSKGVVMVLFVDGCGVVWHSRIWYGMRNGIGSGVHQ